MIKKEKKEKEISRVLRTWHLEQGQRPNIYIYISHSKSQYHSDSN